MSKGALMMCQTFQFFDMQIEQHGSSQHMHMAWMDHIFPMLTRSIKAMERPQDSPSQNFSLLKGYKSHRMLPPDVVREIKTELNIYKFSSVILA
jgi:hypothetical protein